MAEIKVLVCDGCGNQDGAGDAKITSYELKDDKRKVKVDYCVNDAKPFTELLKKGVPATRSGRTPRAAG